MTRFASIQSGNPIGKAEDQCIAKIQITMVSFATAQLSHLGMNAI
jgi:hypothetical protein